MDRSCSSCSWWCRTGWGIYCSALGALICCRCYWLLSQAAGPAPSPWRPHHECVCGHVWVCVWERRGKCE